MNQPTYELMTMLSSALPQTALAVPPSDGEFVRAVYQSVLGRADIDEQALAFWTEALAAADPALAEQARAAFIHTLVYSPFSRSEDGLWSQGGEPDAQTDLAATLAAIESGVEFSAEPTQVSHEGVLQANGTGTALAVIGVNGHQQEAGFAFI